MRTGSEESVQMQVGSRKDGARWTDSGDVVPKGISDGLKAGRGNQRQILSFSHR